MKIKLQKNQSENSFFIEIPSTFNSKQINIGEKFTVYLHENNIKKPIEACFIADKKSLLIENNIVRLTKLNNSQFLQTTLVRPIEPKKRLIKKGLGDLKSPMTGKVISVLAQNEQAVKVGDVLVVIEAMKMENRIMAEGVGMVKNIKVKTGTNVTAGETLMTIVEESIPQ